MGFNSSIQQLVELIVSIAYLNTNITVFFHLTLHSEPYGINLDSLIANNLYQIDTQHNNIYAAIHEREVYVLILRCEVQDSSFDGIKYADIISFFLLIPHNYPA